ncbi:MAG: replication initiation protein [Bacteroidota bacterium]
MSTSNPHLIVKSNRLINAHLNGLTLTQLRFLEILVAQLDRSQSEFSKQKVYLNDFVNDIGTNNKNEYQRAREVTKSMMKHVIEIFDDDEGLKQRNIFHSVDFPKGKSFVEVVFHPHLRPYLLQLKEKFTAYDIRNTLHLSSVYAVQIYQLLKQYHRIGTREFELQELKKILGVEKKYKLYADFKKRVLLSSQKELKTNCDIAFTFREKKHGRKVCAILFYIKSQAKKRDETGVKEPKTYITNDVKRLEVTLQEMGLSKKQIDDCLDKYSTEKLWRLVEYTRERFNLGQVENPTAYMLALLKKEVTIQMHPLAEKKKQPNKEKQKFIQEGELIDQFKIEFEEIRKDTYNKLVKNASTEDIKRFESYAKHIPFLKNKFFENGKLNINHPDFETWLGNYLAPDFDISFIEWAKEQKGYHLKKADGETFKIVGKQSTLF